MSPRAPLLSFIACFLTSACLAQDPSGFTVQKKKGLAMVKTQPWSNPKDAVVVEFEAFSDRTVKGTPGAGYYEFQTKSQEKKQIAASKVVRLVIYPDPSQFTHLVETDERGAIAATVADLEKLVVEYPVTKTYVSGSINALQAEMARFDAGGIKVEGQWRNRESYRGAQAATIGRQLMADITAAKSASSFDLQADTRFIALNEMAPRNADAAALVRQITEVYDGRVRAEQRNQILMIINSAGTTPSDAQAGIERLKTLKPSEDPRIDSVLKSWTEGKAAVDTANAAANALGAVMESEIKSSPADVPPVFSLATTAQFKDLQSQIQIFLAASPPPALVSLAAPARQAVAAWTGFVTVSGLFATKQFLKAKDALDEMSPAAASVGPLSKQAVTVLQRQAAAKIEEFSRLRQEGELLATSGKGPEALRKFEAAYAVIPDPAVSEMVTKLKNSGN